MAFENIEDAARNGLHYVELRFHRATWQWHISRLCRCWSKRVIDGVREGCRRTHLCRRSFIGIMSRTFRRSRLVSKSWRPFSPLHQITAFDLAGDELVSRKSVLSHFNRALRMRAGILPSMQAKLPDRKAFGRRFVNWGASVLTWRKKPLEDRALMDFLAEPNWY